MIFSVFAFIPNKDSRIKECSKIDALFLSFQALKKRKKRCIFHAFCQDDEGTKIPLISTYFNKQKSVEK